MLKKAFVFILLAMSVTAFAYAAPDRTGRWDAGVSVAGAMPTDGDVDATVQVGGNVAYGVTEWFAVGASSGWQSHGLDDASESGITIEGPDLTGIPLFGELIFRVPTGQEHFTPYGVVGLGVVFWDVDDTTANVGGTTVNIETDVDTVFALKLGGGLDWFVNDNWIIFFEGAYVFSNPDATLTASAAGVSITSDPDDLDLDYWTVGGGVKFVF